LPHDEAALAASRPSIWIRVIRLGRSRRRTPDYIRISAAQGDCGTGRRYVGVLVTKALLIAADPKSPTAAPRGASCAPTTNRRPRGRRGLDACATERIADDVLTSKQYIVIAVSGGSYSGEYLAFSLPATSEAMVGVHSLRRIASSQSFMLIVLAVRATNIGRSSLSNLSCKIWRSAELS